MFEQLDIMSKHSWQGGWEASNLPNQACNFEDSKVRVYLNNSRAVIVECEEAC
jgi:hypothetical protein